VSSFKTSFIQKVFLILRYYLIELSLIQSSYLLVKLMLKEQLKLFQADIINLCLESFLNLIKINAKLIDLLIENLKLIEKHLEFCYLLSSKYFSFFTIYLHKDLSKIFIADINFLRLSLYKIYIEITSSCSGCKLSSS